MLLNSGNLPDIKHGTDLEWQNSISTIFSGKERNTYNMKPVAVKWDAGWSDGLKKINGTSNKSGEKKMEGVLNKVILSLSTRDYDSDFIIYKFLNSLG